MHRAAELLWQWGAGRVVNTVVNWTVTIRTPVTLERTGIQIQHCNSLVAIAVSKEYFICFCIDCYFSDLSKVSSAVAVSVVSRFTVLSNELSVTSKDENVRVAATVAANPDVTVRSYIDAVV